MALSQAEPYRLGFSERVAAAPWVAAVAGSKDLRRALLLATDVVVIGLSYLLSSWLTLLLGREVDVRGHAAALLFALVWVASLIGNGSHSLRHARAGSIEYKRAINASLLAGGSMGVLFYLVSLEYPRVPFVSWLLFGIAGLCIARFVRRKIMKRLHLHGVFLTPILIAGSGTHIDEVARVLQREKWIGYSIRGAVTDDQVSATSLGVPVLGSLSELPELLDSTGVASVVFAEGSFDSATEFRRFAWQLEESDVQVALAPTLADVSAERLEFRPLAGLPLVDVGRPTAAKSLRWLKRTADIIGSAVALILAFPVLLVAMIAIKLEDRGPVFFRQRRVGLHGEEFDCLKLRSMCVDAEARLAALQSQNEGAGVLFKMKDDPRITRVGKFIRRYSIDELPQLWNTMVGDMSLVGPRPALPKEVALYDSDTRRRLRVRPGLTGLWQVSGRSSLSWEDTVRLDLYYVDNWSFVQDIMILLKTAKAVIGSDGAY